MKPDYFPLGWGESSAVEGIIKQTPGKGPLAACFRQILCLFTIRAAAALFEWQWPHAGWRQPEKQKRIKTFVLMLKDF